MLKSTLGAVAAAGLLAGGLATSASAADFGGNCCADLEERIAELEATTARKGNRKVSLTISGFVAKQLLYWDDGFESNTYITDTGSVSIGTHVAFTGQATIAPGWSAGYVLKIEMINDDSLLQNQNNDDGIFAGANAQAIVANGVFSDVTIESSYWFIKSEQLGRISLGQQSSAADNQAILPDGSGSLIQANYVLYDINGFSLRNSAGGAINLTAGGFAAASGFGVVNQTYAQLANCYPLTDAPGNGGGGVAGDCDGYPKNVIRYDTPTFAGFSGSASWGEDDDWAVSGRYAGEFTGFKIALAAAYNHTSDEGNVGGVFTSLGLADRPPGFEGGAWQVGGYIQHVATGLFLYGAYIEEINDSNTGFAEWDTKVEGDTWYLKAGIRQKWTPLGHTVLYGEYGNDSDKMSTLMFGTGITSSELERYGVGVVQEIDAAAMSVWLAWRHYEPEVTCNPGAVITNFGACNNATGLVAGNNDLEEFDLIKAGALINF